MASRNSFPFGFRFRKPKSATSETEIATEKDENNDPGSDQTLNVNKDVSEPIITPKISNSTDWSQCSCCLNSLHKNNSQSCVPTPPKSRHCDNCQGCVCKACRIKGICHECFVRKEITLQPESMMELDEDKLRDYIYMLHYPQGGFKNCPKPFLVKQILVRFKMFDDWDPKMVAPVQILTPQVVPALEDEISGFGSNINLREKLGAVPFTKIEVRDTSTVFEDAAIFKHQSKSEDVEVSLEQKVAFQMDVEKALKCREERQQRQINAPKPPQQNGGSQDTERNKSASPYEELKPEEKVLEDSLKQPHRHHHKHHSKRHDEVEMVELHELATEDDIKQLRKSQLRHILKQNKIDTKQLNGRLAYQQIVTQLWNENKQTSSNNGKLSPVSEVEVGDVTDQPIRPHKQLHRLQYRNSFELLKPESSIPRAISLKEIPATSFTENLTNEQLAEILVYHNFDPDEYPGREDMLFAVLCLWHAIKRGKTLPAILSEYKNRPQKLNLGHKENIVIEQLASPIEIENLDPIQMRNILISNDVDPTQYEDDTELYLAVVNVWSGVTESNQKSPQTSAHRTEAATAKIVSKWLHQDEKQKGVLAPLALMDDVSFIDDDAESDFNAMDCDEVDVPDPHFRF